jgi:transcriptional regulator with XRE-family HTH domain
MDVVLRLRELRRLRGLSQKEAALSSGVGEKTLSSFESGERVMSMKLTQLLSLLHTYDIAPAEFFGGAIEAEVFGELERLDAVELTLVRQLRQLPTDTRAKLAEKFLTMTAAVQTVTIPALHAVR